MFTGPAGPVEVCFYWPKAIFEEFYWPGTSGLPLVSRPGVVFFSQLYSVSVLIVVFLYITAKREDDTSDSADVDSTDTTENGTVRARGKKRI